MRLAYRMVVSDGNKAYPLDTYSKIAKIKVGEVENDVVLGLKRDGYGYIDGGPEGFKQYLVTYSIPDDAAVRKLKSDEARVSVATVRAVEELHAVDSILPDVLEGRILPAVIALHERLTYDQLFKATDNGRIDRANTQVRGPALEVESAQDSTYYFFNVKSFPSTTGLRHKGYIRFFKPRMANPDQYQALEKLDVMVDCVCPDFRYRWAWSLKQRQSSLVGPQSLNQAHNRAPRITNPTNKISLCKHLASCKDYIYGARANFPQGDSEPNILNKLTRYATKRWLDIGGAMAQGRAREAAYSASVQATRRSADRPEPRPVQLPTRPGEPVTGADAASSYLEQLEERAIAQNVAVAAAEAFPAVSVQGSATTPSTAATTNTTANPTNTAESIVFKTNTTAIMPKINPLKLIEEVIEDETEALDAAEAEDTSIALPPPGGPADAPADEGSEALDILRDIRDGIQTLVSVEAGDEEGEEKPEDEKPEGEEDEEDGADDYGVDFAPEEEGGEGGDDSEGSDREYSFEK